MGGGWLGFAEQAFLWWLCYSCIGWVWETGLNLVTRHRLVDRGALNGPICPIYGNGALLVFVLLHDVDSPVALFLGGGVIACTLEYVVSWLIERLFHVRLWDYTGKPFNLNGRVYLNGFLAFGAGAAFAKTVVQPWLAGMTARIGQPWLHVVAGTLLVLVLLDWLASTMGMADLDNRLARLGEELKAERLSRIDETNVAVAAANARLESGLRAAREDALKRAERVRGRAEEVRGRLDALTEERLRRALTWQQRRLLRAFPSLSSRSRRDLTDAIHDLLSRR